MDINVAMPLYPGFDSLDVMGPLQVFTYAEMSVTLLAENAGLVTSLEGVQIQATLSFDTAQQFDVLFVPGGSKLETILQVGPRAANPYLQFLIRQASQATLVCSVCTGALLLAAAGLLDDQTVTTHWAYKDVLRLFPVCVIDDYRRYVQSGNVITGAGISSGIDEALYIVAKLRGIDAARRSQLAMQYHPQPVVHCGDPDQPDVRDVPDLPASIQRDWRVQSTAREFQLWIDGGSQGNVARV